MTETSDCRKLRNLLASTTPESCPRIINLHCHTTCSDGSMDPLELIKQAYSIGLKHICITDHHSVDAFSYLDSSTKYNILKKRLDFPKLWTGVEISCLLSRCLVHIIGMGFNRFHNSIVPYVQNESPTVEYIQANNVVDAIHQAGGIAILAHPARYRLGYKKLILDSAQVGIDGAEAWYDYEFNQEWRYSPFICDKIYRHIVELGLLASCGTDTHGYSLLGR